MKNNMTKAKLVEALDTAEKRIAELEQAQKGRQSKAVKRTTPGKVHSALTEGETLFTRVFQTSPLPMTLTNIEDSRLVEVNGAFLNLLHFSRDEVIGKTSDELGLFEQPARQLELFERLKEQGYLWGEPVTIKAKTGELLYEVFSAEYMQTEGRNLLLTVMNDVTERKRVNLALQQSEAYYRALIETLDVSLCRWLPDTTLTFANERYKHIFGVTGDPRGQKWLNFLPDDSRESTAAFYRDLANAPHVVTYEHPVKVEDGSTRHFQWTDTPIFNGDGRLVEFQSVGIDIHERKAAEAAVRESEERLKRLLEAAPDAMIIANKEGKIILANRHAETVFGYSQEEFTYMRVENLMPAERRSEHIHSRNIFLENPRHVIAGVIREIHALRKDGSRFPVEISLSHLKLDNELFVLSTVRDVTERMKEKLALEVSEANYRSLAENSESAIAVLNYDGVILYANPVSQKIWGNTLLTGVSVHELFPTEIADGYLNVLRNTLRTGTADTNELSAEVNGNVMWFHSTLSPIKNRDGSVSTVLFSALDITERKKSEERTHLLTAALEAAANGIVITDLRGNIEWVNPAWCRLSGYSFEEAHGRSAGVVKSGLHDHAFYKHMWLTISSGQTWSGELHNKHKNGDLFIEDTVITPVFNRTGQITSYIGIKQDATARIQAEQERQTLIYNLNERIKELTALHQATRILQHTTRSEGETLQALVEILPPAMRYPEYSAARITLQDYSVSTPGFEEMPKMYTAHFSLPDGRKGKVEVSCTNDELFEADNPAIIFEEQNLVEIVASRLQGDLTRRVMELDLRKRTEHLATLLEAGRALSETLDPQKMYPVIYEHIAQTIPCDFVIISSFNPRTEMIVCDYLHSNEGPQDASGFPAIPLEPPGKGTQSRVIRSGVSLLLPDYEAAIRTANTTMYFNEKAEIIEDQDVEEDQERARSGIIVPLKVNGEISGVLQVLSVTLNAHTEEHLQFVETLAFHISTALSNAKLFAELEKRVEERTTEVRDLFDNAPIGYHSLDHEGRYVNINQTELDWLGYTREEMLNCHFTDFIAPDMRERFIKESFPALKNKGWASNLEFDMIRMDGSTFPALINATAVYDKDGHYVISRSTLFDNTERRKAELALRESEEVYRALFESANDAIFLLDDQRRVVSVNSRCTDLLGYSYTELIGRNSMEFIVAAEEPEAGGIFQRVLQGEHIPVYERRFIRKDGSVIEAEINLSLVKDELGRPKLVQSVVRDISARKRADSALRESEEQNRLLFEEAPEAVVLFDQTGRMVRMNRAFEHITGLPVSESVGRMITDTGISPRILMEAMSIFTSNTPQHKENFAQLEFKITQNPEDVRDVSIRIYALNMHGEPHYLASMHDITTSKKAEETLRLANTEMERALRLKDEFLANMSHELRTPLNAVLGITESLLEQVSGPLNERQQKYLQTVLESAHHLLDLINDILDLAKINAGRIDLDIHKLSVAAVAQASLRMVKELAQKKTQTLKLEIEPGIQFAWADERRLKQMLVNLLSNAVKFTPNEGSLGLEIYGDRLHNILRFTVWDTGIGITPEDLRMLFKPFVQLDAGLSRGNQGTGLGLVLVSQMARLHGGSISVKSEPGQGSRFTLAIPWMIEEERDFDMPEVPNAPHPVEKMPSALTGKLSHPTILLVEDTEAVTMLIHDYLEQHGFNVLTASDGYDGLALAEKTPPDLILMDVMMPEMDGFETTRRIRRELGMLEVPIIALTALAMAGDRERCLEAGMNDYLSKPVKLKELLHTVHKYLKREEK